MQRITIIASVILAAAVLAVAAAPAQARPDAPLGVVREVREHQYLQARIHALQARNDVQAELIKDQWAKLAELEAEVAALQARSVSPAEALATLELSPVTLSQLLAWRDAGVGFGRLYVTP